MEWVPFQLPKIRVVGIATILEQEQKGDMPKKIYLFQTNSYVYDGSSFRVQFNPVVTILVSQTPAWNIYR